MKSSFSTRITRLRREKGLSQKEAASILGISQSLLSHYENGIRECGLDFLIKIAGYYGVTCDFLLGCSQNRDGLPDYNEQEAQEALTTGNVSNALIINSIYEILENFKDTNNIQFNELKDYMVLFLYRTAILSGGDMNPGLFRLKSSAAKNFSKGLMEYHESQMTRNNLRRTDLMIENQPSLRAVIGSAEKKILENMREVVKSVG